MNPAGVTRAPLIVVPAAADVEVTARRLREGGHRAQRGFDLPPEPFDLSGERLTCAGIVADRAEAVAALVAAVRGAGLVVSVGLAADEADVFLDDLARIGPILRPPAAPAVAGPQLSPEQRQLLEILAAGATVPDAARQLYLSVRTAERRIGEIRRVLGVRTTAEAVLAARAATAVGGRPGESGGDWGWSPGGPAVASTSMESER